MSRWNARKHGLLAKEVVISAGDGKENRAEFCNLLSNLQQDLQPVGVLEEILVERIAVCYWRLGRAQRCETGEIRGRLDNLRYKQFERETKHLDAMQVTLAMELPETGLKDSSAGIQFLQDSLLEVTFEVERLGYIPQDTHESLVRCFGPVNRTIGFLAFLSKLVTGVRTLSEEQAKDPNLAKFRDPSIAKATMLDMLKREMRDLQRLKRNRDRCEKLEMESRSAALALPGERDVEKNLRYETAIDRQFYRALDELERLQRQRRGESLPPPVKIQVSGEK